MLLLASCTQPTPAPTAEPTLSPSPTPAVATLAPEPTAVPTEAQVPGSTPAPTSTPDAAPTSAATTVPTPNPGEVYSRILDAVARERGLAPTEDVLPQFMTREELEATLVEDLEENAEDILHAELVYKMLGLMTQDSDLYQLLLDLYTEQVAGFYDSETEELFLIAGAKDDLSALDEITLAHEFTHALQQQHFDIDAMLEAVEDNSDASTALRALVEGDASVAQFQYLIAQLARERQIEALTGSRNVDSSAFDSAPYILRQSLVFPYDGGADFVTALQATAVGWDDVDDAYSNPPASTEQVLHPPKYLSGEAPVEVSLPDIAVALGEDWEVVYSDVMGEFFIRTYLETRTTASAAADAAAGWGGDRFALLQGPGDEYALVSNLEWDTAQDAGEFLDTMSSSNSVSDEDYLGLEGTRTLWILSPSQEITGQIMSLWPEF